MAYLKLILFFGSLHWWSNKYHTLLLEKDEPRRPSQELTWISNMYSQICQICLVGSQKLFSLNLVEDNGTRYYQYSMCVCVCVLFLFFVHPYVQMIPN